MAFAEGPVGKRNLSDGNWTGQGRTVALLDKASGQKSHRPGIDLSLLPYPKGDTAHDVSAVTAEGETLHVVFGESGIEAILRVERLPRYFILSVLSLNDAECGMK